MKKIVISSLLLIVLMINTLQASNEPEVFVNSGASDTKIIKVLFDNLRGAFKIKINDLKGVELYYENVKENNFRKSFDMNQLPKGIYIMEIEDETKIWTYRFTLDRHAFALLDKKTTTFCKPIIRQKDKKVYITKYLDKAQQLSISLTNKEGQIIYEEFYNKGTSYARSLNLNKLIEGTYQLQISSQNKNYYRSIKI